MNELNISPLLKELRLNYGMSQQALAASAQVSLPTIQKIESGFANLTIDVLDRILKAFGYELKMVSKDIDIDELVSLGLPLISKKHKQYESSFDMLKKNVLGLIPVYKTLDNRTQEALQSLILALSLHYPQLYKTHFAKSIVDKWKPQKITGRHIKLYRIAKVRLAEYL